MIKVLVIGYVWPEPNSSAAGSHMLSLLKLFKQQAWNVTFATPAKPTEHQFDLATISIEGRTIELNDSSFDAFVSTLQPDIVLFDRFMMEEQFGWRVEKHCPNALRILDTEDLQSLRNARHLAVKQNRELTQADYHSELALREIAAIYRSDLSLIISDAEAAILDSLYHVPTHLLHHLPFMLDLTSIPQQVPTFTERQHCLMIGNFRHAPNWDSVLQAQRTWPDIRKELKQKGISDVELHIYGAYPPPKATALHNPKIGFLIKGWAENAFEVMQQTRLCLAPLRFGAGIKGKLLDAMICGTPSVTTPIGAEGMHDDTQWPGAIATTDDEFIERTVFLYTQQSAWDEAQAYGLMLAKKRYNGDPLGKALIERILEIKSSLTQHRLNNFTGAMLNHHHHKSTQYMSQWIEAKNKLADTCEDANEDT